MWSFEVVTLIDLWYVTQTDHVSDADLIHLREQIAASPLAQPTPDRRGRRPDATTAIARHKLNADPVGPLHRRDRQVPSTCRSSRRTKDSRTAGSCGRSVEPRPAEEAPTPARHSTSSSLPRPERLCAAFTHLARFALCDPDDAPSTPGRASARASMPSRSSGSRHRDLRALVTTTPFCAVSVVGIAQPLPAQAEARALRTFTPRIE